ncbi:MAG: xanthine dehydrogenase family protein molybdopterin-binding subunit, partial [Kibdelosporangium sp.]
MTSILRPDGPVKLTGAACYAADTVIANMAYATLVTATVPNGHLASLDTSAASAAPGVLRVLDHNTFPKLSPLPSPPLGHSVIPLQDNEIRYDGQPIALVLASSPEHARHAAELVTATYSHVTPPLVFGRVRPIVPAGGHNHGPVSQSKGDIAAGLAAADKTVRQT